MSSLLMKRHHWYKIFTVACMAGVLLFIVQALFVHKSETHAESTLQQPQLEKQVKALVLPHHDLIIDQFPLFYQQFPDAQRSTVSTVILLSPNHNHPDRTLPTIPDVGYQRLPTIDQTFLSKLDSNLLLRNSEDFSNEHGVLIHQPFIQQTFPKAQIVPILLTRHISQKNIDNLNTFLTTELENPDTILLASIDFSHDLSYSEAEKRDAQTIQFIENSDSQQLLTLDDTYLDCPACVYTIIEIGKKKELEREVFFHDNSSRYLPNSEDLQTTSYFGIKWSE